MFEMKPEAKPLPADFNDWFSAWQQFAKDGFGHLLGINDGDGETIARLYENYRVYMHDDKFPQSAMSYSDFIDCVRRCGAFELRQVWHAALRV